jgi:hypothetical protein
MIMQTVVYRIVKSRSPVEECAPLEGIYGHHLESLRVKGQKSIMLFK